MKKEVDLETTPCAIAFAHPQVTMFYCEGHPQGATQDVRQATKYIGKKARNAGLDLVLSKYPQTDRKGLIFHFIPQGVQ